MSWSGRMALVARRDTRPELRLRQELHRRGLRFRVDRSLPGLPRRRADVVFGPSRVVVFVDGCFWHGCPEHGHLPRRNRSYWIGKIAANRDRDRDTDARLTAAGWCVVRVWEHEDPARAADHIEVLVRLRRPARSRASN